MSRFTETLPASFWKATMAYTKELPPYGFRNFVGRDFVINMFQEDVNEMGRWVLKHPHNETGGDLFGLWTPAEHGNKLEPVIHVVLGPGSGCRRTSTSFFQSIPYLKKVGSLLTQKYMLGHIGEWHSHHQLGLFEPSGGDSNTVCTNFPRGAYGFILIIVNILSHKEVKISPYLYSENSRHYQTGRVEIIPGKSPFRAKTFDIPRAISEGAEVEVTRYIDRESAMDIDYETAAHRLSRSAKRQSVNRHRGYNESTNITLVQNIHQGKGASEQSPVIASSSARASITRSPSPERRLTNRPTYNRKLNTSQEEKDTSSSSDVSPLEAATGTRSHLPSVNPTGRPLVSDESTEVKTSHEPQVPGSGAPPDHTPYPAAGNASASRGGETERSSQGSDESPPNTTTYESHYQNPSGQTLTSHSPPSGVAVEHRSKEVSLLKEQKNLPPIGNKSTGLWSIRKNRAISSTTNSPSRRSPSPVRQSPRYLPSYSAKSNDATGEQWYDTEEGKNRLEEIFDELQNEQDVKPDRSRKTNDLRIRFKCHQRRWFIDFPRNFPESDVTLNGPQFNEEVKINRETLSVKDLMKKIVHNVRFHCPTCSQKYGPSRSPLKTGAGDRSSSVHHTAKGSGSIRPGFSRSKAKTETAVRPRWR